MSNEAPITYSGSTLALLAFLAIIFVKNAVEIIVIICGTAQ